MDVVVEELARFVADQQRRFDSGTSASERKQRGHFGTPQAISQFMAGLFSEWSKEELRILDPGAGVGALSVAICQRAIAEPLCRRVHVELWESDPKLQAILDGTMRHCQEAMLTQGKQLSFAVREGDFILEHSQRSLFTSGPEPSFDLAILNPPYFKIRKESRHAQAMRHVVHGQPNIYALFMAVAADLLVSNGELVAITPRSYFNGPYFKKFRKWFFDRMSVRRIHLFESRTEAFKDDAVLQENVILHAQKHGAPTDVVLTSSRGRDMNVVERHSAPYATVIDNRGGDHIVRVTTGEVEREVVSAVDRLPSRLGSLGLEVSTGPVVTFRSTEFLCHERSAETAPLLWMHNVRPFVTRFPSTTEKPSHIKICATSQKLLVPASRYVLLKRFTAKEEKRRLVAGILTREDSYSDCVGLENHLNYVYRPGNSLEEVETYGLAAFFNSALVDRYFRTISGNTQVNASELRSLPMPDKATLWKIGDAVRKLRSREPVAIEEIVGRALSLRERLIEQLVEDAS